MKMKVAQAFFAMAFTLGAVPAFADHALLEDGRVLYNVMVPEGITTGGAKLVRIRTGSMSFSYDPRTNVVSTLPSHSVIHRISDYITTTTTVGREGATSLVQQRRWDRYVPMASHPPLVAPSPAPKATPIPIALAQAAEKPLNVVSDTVPLEQRLNQQLDIFMKEQTTMAQDATTSMVRGLLSAEQVTARKAQLVETQRSILQNHYPQNAETVRLAVEYWSEQVERTRQSGRFDLENL